MASSDELNNSNEKLVHFVVGAGPVYSPTLTSSCSDESTEDERDTEDDDDGGKIKVGVCAMAKKSRSRPMQEILERLVRFKHIETFVFDEEVILNQPVENWPICDCLISFHSKGFPLEKAVQYVEVRQPFVINDLKSQYTLQDRSKVYQILSYHGIDKPRYAVMNRDPSFEGMCQFVEADDYIEVNGATFHKPFVEKPVSAEDHNVYIYFPSSAGGGSQRLFRKIGSRSSVYSPISTVRKVGSFMYEEFMPTDGTDVKVYTVGPDYAHAEARKSPALDGKVERDKDGKEIRYPVLLSAKEKMIARTVCLAFKQNVCGFDLLRANGKSYVCDVNGFSFVKTSPKYYDDCAKILGNMILRKLAPTLHIPYSITYQAEDIPIVPTTSGTMMELRCVVAVMRHGDRTPKQKMKMEVKHKMFFSLFEKYGGLQAGHLKLKHPKQLQEVLDIARFLLYEAASHSDSDVEEKRSKLEQLKSVLEMYGHFSGINRKVQFKYQPHGCAGKSPDGEPADKENQNNNKNKSKKKKKDKSSLCESSSSSSAPSQNNGEPSLVLILKWGGELTPAGKIQAEELGKAFRCMYPGGRVSLLLIPPLAGDYGQSPGLGLLRLHSTFRHDLKIYASDEGRVQMTAAAFAKGFLALEGELTPILVQMVKSANMNGLLDNENQPLKFHNEVKERLQEMMNANRQFTEDDFQQFVPTGSSSVMKAMQYVGNPREACVKMHDMMNKLMERVKELKDDPKAEDMRLYHGESWELMNRRWGKLIKDFLRPDGEFDISKIPDIYDCIKYDLQHNSKVLRFSDTEELHTMAKAMADIVIPQEYGMTLEEKVSIGRCICSPLLRKILADFLRNEDGDEPTRLDSRYSEGVTSPQRHVKTRLYFTSESHIHSLLTILRFGGLCDVKVDEQWSRAMDYVGSVSELNYLSQIVIMLYEDPTKAPNSDERFHVELHFSPGAYCVGQNKEYLAGRGYRPQHGEKKKQQENLESESTKQPVREVLTSPSQLHVIETVPEEDPSQVPVTTSEVTTSLASRDSRSPVQGVGRVVSPCRNAPLLEKQRLPPLNLPPLSLQEYTCKDRSSRSTIRKTFHPTAPAHQDVEEICSSSSEMEDQSSVDAKRLKTGRIIVRKSAERSKDQPPHDLGKASSNSESGPRSSVDSHFESSSDNLSSAGHRSQEQAEKIEDPVMAEEGKTGSVAPSETLNLYMLKGNMSGLTAVNSVDVPTEPSSPGSSQLPSAAADIVSHTSFSRQNPTEQLYLQNTSKVVFTSMLEKITTETVETITTKTAPISLSFSHSYEGAIISSGTVAQIQKSVDFTPDYSLANHIVHLEKPIRSQSPGHGDIEGTALANAAVVSKLTSSQTSVISEAWSVGPSPVPPLPSTVPGLSTILSPTTTATTASSSPSVESSKYNSCNSSTANSPARVALISSQVGQVIQESVEHDQAAIESEQQQSSDVDGDVVTERLSARSSNSDKMVEGGSSRRRHQSSGSIEGSSTREREMMMYPNNNTDVCQQQQQQQQQHHQQQQQPQQHFDFYDTPSFPSQLPNLSMVETTPPTSISALASNDSFVQPSPSSSNVERTAKETRSRSLETLQKKDHHQREHHHHHHHHHHKEHGRHKRSSFLALFNSPNSESIDGWRVPSLRPLETLHNSLTLRQLEKFIKLVTESFNKSPDPMMSSYESNQFPRKDIFRDDSAAEKASYCSSLEACFKPPVLPPDPPNLRATSSLSSSSSSQSPVKHSNVDEFRLDMSLNV